MLQSTFNFHEKIVHSNLARSSKLIGAGLLGFALITLLLLWPQFAQAHQGPTQNVFAQKQNSNIPLLSTVPLTVVVSAIAPSPVVGKDVVIQYKVVFTVGELSEPATVTITNQLSGPITVTGQTLNWITNKGGASGNLNLTDNLLITTIPSLTSNEVVTLTFSSKTLYPSINGDKIRNDTTINPIPIDIKGGSIIHEVLDLIISVTPPVQAWIQTGGTLKYTLKAEHKGNRDPSDAKVTFTLPPNTLLVKIMNNNTGMRLDPPDYTTLGSDVVLSNVSVLSTTARSWDIELMVDNILPYPLKNLTSKASIIDETDPGKFVPPNITKPDTEANVEMILNQTSLNTEVPPDGILVYKVTVDHLTTPPNNSKRHAENIWLTLNLPSPVKAENTFVSGGSCVQTYKDASKIILNVSTLNVGTQLVCELHVTVDSIIPHYAESLTSTVVMTYYQNKYDEDTKSGLQSPTKSLSITLKAYPKLQLSETPFPSVGRPGQPLTYTIGVTNSEAQSAAGVVITKTLPASVTLLSYSGDATHPKAGVVAVYNHPHLVWTFTTPVTKGVVNQLMASVMVSTDTLFSYPITQTVVMTASFNANDQDKMGETTSAISHSIVITSAPNLDLQLSGPSTVDSGATVAYTLVISNHGFATAKGVVVKINQTPANMTLNSAVRNGSSIPYSGSNGVWMLNLGDFAPTDPVQTIVLTFTANPLTGSDIMVNNVVTVTESEGYDPIATNNFATKATIIKVVSDIKMEFSGPLSPVGPGEVLRYTLVITNVGFGLANNVVVQIPKPDYSILRTGNTQTNPVGYVIEGNMVKWVIPSLAINIPQTFNVEAVLTNTLPYKQFTLTSTATVNITQSKTITVGVTVPATLTVGQSYTPRWAEPGGLITYTIWITNKGNIDADTGSTVINITTSDYVIYKSGGQCNTHSTARSKDLQPISINLPAGQVVSCTITLKVDATNLPASLWDTGLENLVSVTTKFAGAIESDSSQLFVPISATSKIDLTNLPYTDTVKNNEIITYTIKVKNSGVIGLKNVKVVYLLPPKQYVNYLYPTSKLDMGDDDALEVGEEMTFELVSLTAQSTLSVPFLTTATVTANNGYSNIAIAKVTIGEFPDLGVKVTPMVDFSDKSGDITVTYAITVKNDSRVLSSGGSLTIGIPQYITVVTTPQCDSQTFPAIPHLAAGAEKSYCFMVKVNNPLASGVDELVSKVEIQAKDTIPTPWNDVREVKVGLDEARPDLAISIAMREFDSNKNNGKVEIDERLLYTLSISRTYNQYTIVPTVTFEVSPEYAFIASDYFCPGQVITVTNSKVDWFVGQTVNDKILTCPIIVQVVKNLPGLGKAMLEATASITDGNVNGPDANVANNTAMLIDEIVPSEGIELTLVSDPLPTTYITQNVITYTLTVINVGQSSADDVVVNITPSSIGTLEGINGCILKKKSQSLYEWQVEPEMFPAQGVDICEIRAIPENKVKQILVTTNIDCDSGCVLTETDVITNYIYQTPIVTMTPSAKTTFLGGVLTYTISITNLGGLDLPVIMTFNYTYPNRSQRDNLPTHFITVTPFITSFTVLKNDDVIYQNVITIPNDGAQTVEVELTWQDDYGGVQTLPKQTTTVYPIVKVDINDYRNFAVPKAVIPYTVTVVSDQPINGMSLTITLPMSITGVVAPNAVIDGLKTIVWSNIVLTKEMTQTFIFTTTVISKTHKDYVDMVSEVKAFATGMEKPIAATDSTLILSPISVIVIGPVSVDIGDEAEFFYIISNIGNDPINITAITSNLTDYQTQVIGTQADQKNFTPDTIIVFTASRTITVPDNIVGPPMLANIVTVNGVQLTDGFEVVGIGGNTPEYIKHIANDNNITRTTNSILTTSITYRGDFEITVAGEPSEAIYTLTIRNLPRPRADGSPVISMTVDYGDGIKRPLDYNRDVQLGQNEVWTHTILASDLPNMISTITVAGLNGSYKPVSHTYILNRYYRSNLPILAEDFWPHPVRVSIAKISQDKSAVSETATILFRLDTVELNGARIESYKAVDDKANEANCDKVSRTCTVKYTIRPTDSYSDVHTLVVYATYRTISDTERIVSASLPYTIPVTHDPQLQYRIINIPGGQDISMIQTNTSILYDVLVSHAPGSDCSPMKAVDVSDPFSNQSLRLETNGDENGTLDCGEEWRYRLPVPYLVPTEQNPFVVKVNVTGYDMDDHPVVPATANTYPVQMCSVLKRENFDGPTTTFALGFLQRGRYSLDNLINQIYQVEPFPSGPAYSASQLGSFVKPIVRSDMQWGQGQAGNWYGLVFGVDRTDNNPEFQGRNNSAYRFVVDSYKQEYALEMFDFNTNPTNWQVVSSWTSNQAIKQGKEPNKLQVICNALSVDLYVNEVLLGTFSGKCNGEVGITVNGSNTSALFHNFDVCAEQVQFGRNHSELMGGALPNK